MNPEAQAVLDGILRKSPDELSPEDIAFLRARVSYLKKSQLEDYDSVLKSKPSETKTAKQDGKSR